MAACRELGLTPDLTAVNHWLVAVETHTANHGSAAHFREERKEGVRCYYRQWQG